MSKRKRKADRKLTDHDNDPSRLIDQRKTSAVDMLVFEGVPGFNPGFENASWGKIKRASARALSL